MKVPHIGHCQLITRQVLITDKAYHSTDQMFMLCILHVKARAAGTLIPLLSRSLVLDTESGDFSKFNLLNYIVKVHSLMNLWLLNLYKM